MSPVNLFTLPPPRTKCKSSRHFSKAHWTRFWALQKSFFFFFFGFVLKQLVLNLTALGRASPQTHAFWLQSSVFVPRSTELRSVMTQMMIQTLTLRPDTIPDLQREPFWSVPLYQKSGLEIWRDIFFKNSRWNNTDERTFHPLKNSHCKSVPQPSTQGGGWRWPYVDSPFGGKSARAIAET